MKRILRLTYHFFTYGFNYLLYPEYGRFLNNTLSKVCSITLLIGLLCIFQGHRCYQMDLVVHTTFFGGLITYIIVKYFASFEITTNFRISIGGSFVLLFIVGIIFLYF